MKHSVIRCQCKIILHVIKLWDNRREREPIRESFVYNACDFSATKWFWNCADVGTAGFIAEKEKLLFILAWFREQEKCAACIIKGCGLGRERNVTF